MSQALDDAKMLLAEHTANTDTDQCGYCGDWQYADDDAAGLRPLHNDGCRVPVYAGIVAALEAAEPAAT